MAASVYKLGPGTLSLGATASALEVSCQLTNAVLTPDKDSEDPVTVLCGDVIPGAVTYNWKLTGTALVDLLAGGMTEYTWTNQNTAVAFEFVPNTAAATSFAGELMIDPLPVGGDSGKNMAQDFEWSLVGAPVPTFSPPAGMDDTIPSTFTYPSSATFPTRSPAPPADAEPKTKPEPERVPAGSKPKA